MISSLYTQVHKQIELDSGFFFLVQYVHRKEILASSTGMPTKVYVGILLFAARKILAKTCILILQK